MVNPSSERRRAACDFRCPARRPSGYTTSYTDIAIPPFNTLFRLHVRGFDNARPLRELGLDVGAELRRVHQSRFRALAQNEVLHIRAIQDVRGLLIKTLYDRSR